MTGVGKRGVGSAKSKKTYKQGLRKTFQKRHIDQVRCSVLHVQCVLCIDVQAQLHDIAIATCLFPFLKPGCVTATTNYSVAS